MPVKSSSGFFGACFALLCLSLGVRVSLVLCWGLVCSGLAVKVFGACCELYCATSWLSVCLFGTLRPRASLCFIDAGTPPGANGAHSNYPFQCPCVKREELEIWTVTAPKSGTSVKKEGGAGIAMLQASKKKAGSLSRC